MKSEQKEARGEGLFEQDTESPDASIRDQAEMTMGLRFLQSLVNSRKRDLIYNAVTLLKSSTSPTCYKSCSHPGMEPHQLAGTWRPTEKRTWTNVLPRQMSSVI